MFKLLPKWQNVATSGANLIKLFWHKIYSKVGKNLLFYSKLKKPISSNFNSNLRSKNHSEKQYCQTSQLKFYQSVIFHMLG